MCGFLENLINYYNFINGSWLVARNFKEQLCNQDKWGGRTANPTTSSLFGPCITNCNLSDLGFKGRRYIWSNHRRKNNGIDVILERPDCVFATDNWLKTYPNTKIVHLPNTHLDQCPLLIYINPSNHPAQMSS